MSEGAEHLSARTLVLAPGWTSSRCRRQTSEGCHTTFLPLWRGSLGLRRTERLKRDERARV
jgi:hypothetical protein